MRLRAHTEIAGRYALRRKLARGGMGELWVARHLELDIDMVVKFIEPSRTMCETTAARFRREAQAAARLRGPHVVRIHDFGSWDGRLYLVMELLNGEDLAKRLSRGALGLAATAALVGQVSGALAETHAAKLVHRDLKPSNIFLAEVGRTAVIKLLDFGIAKDLASDDERTASGAQVGSPRYMSPEQMMGETVDPRSDLWSLACVAYEALTGTHPFEGDTQARVYTEIAAGRVRPLSEELARHRELEAFFRRALARDPKERFASAEDLALAFGVAAQADVGAELPLDPPELAALVPRDHLAVLGLGIAPRDPPELAALVPRDEPTVSSDWVPPDESGGAAGTAPRPDASRSWQRWAWLPIAATGLVTLVMVASREEPASPGASEEPPSPTSAPAPPPEPVTEQQPTAPAPSAAAAADAPVDSASSSPAAPAPRAVAKPPPRPAAPASASPRPVDPFSGLPYPQGVTGDR